MPRVDVNEAAAPATRAAEKVRLLIAMGMRNPKVIGSNREPGARLSRQVHTRHLLVGRRIDSMHGEWTGASDPDSIRTDRDPVSGFPQMNHRRSFEFAD
jgi:hypothetical protein